ncbi:tRNA (adenosine(37)-N6)-dimethylallyltransferase MiaA, partial [bacterium]|nr:tRNA (adenosine(37)-N6)-dimethylallyltransferase MiaA [bacterium]
ANPQVLIVAGPTASGKSDVAVRLAKRLDGEVINADSRQVYRFLDIGTAKPTEEERGGIPHHGFDVADPDERYSAGRYAREARQWIEVILARGRTPIIAGGTGLYLQALVDGFFGEDAKDPDIRAELESRERLSGLEPLYAELSVLDPTYAAKTQPGDRQRILRALEATLAAGIPFSELHASGRDPSLRRFRWFGLHHSREALYERINHRVGRMLDRGLTAEVRDLLDRGYRGTNALKSVGYQEIIAWLDGELASLDEAAELIRRNTRHYAKRQMTWFRANERVRWIEAEGATSEAAADTIAGLLEEHPE